MSRGYRAYLAEWVVPVAAPPIRNGVVVVDPEGQLVAVAPAGVLELGEDVPVQDLGFAALLPGLVNVHAHPELAMFRGALEDLPFRDWILRLVGGKRNVLTEEDSAAAARLALAESLSAGITTIGATEASGASAVALTEARARGIVYQEVFGPDPEQATDAVVELEASVARLRGASGGRVVVGVSPHAPYTVSDELYREATEFAVRHGLPMALHIAESVAERELVATGAGDFAPGLRARGIATPPRARSPVELLRRLGVLDARPLLIHCVDLDEEDIGSIADSGAAVAHCPIANARLGHGVAPLTELLASGVRVGLGTDSVASNNRQDILEEARVASLLQRARHGRFDLLSAPELLRLATIEGARALGLEEQIGTLEPGKQADFCVVSLAGLSALPCHDPVTALVHSARGTDVTMTVVGGEVLYEGGEHRTIDVAGATAAVEGAAERLRAWARG